MNLSPGLTGQGMTELNELGTYCRNKYILGKDKFLPKTYNDQTLVQAVESERTLQSAYAFSQGLYPKGMTPKVIIIKNQV